MKKYSEVIALETFLFPVFLLIHFPIVVGFLKEKIKLSIMKSGMKRNRRFQVCKVKLASYNVQNCDETQASSVISPLRKPACHTWTINGLLSPHFCVCVAS